MHGRRTHRRVRREGARSGEGSDVRARGRAAWRVTATAVAVGFGVTVAGGVPAVAQDVPDDESPAGDAGDPGAPDADGAPAGEPLIIDESTLYVSPATDALPPTLVTQFPPEAVCVLRPEVCAEQLDPVRGGLRSAVGSVLEESTDLPVQPVPEGTAAVSYFGGSPRYQTAIRFATPDIPADEEPSSVVLTVPQGQPSYHLSSPLYRGAFLATFAAIGDQDPAVFVEEFSRELGESAPLETTPLLGVEACPLLSGFEPGGAPEASPDDELPTREEDDEEVPDVDCILGSSGVLDEATGTWSFDLTFAAAAWHAGELENHGVLLRPTGGPNLAFGDPDTSTNAQVILELEEAAMSVTTAEPFEPLDPPPPLDGTAAPSDTEPPPPAPESDFGDGDDLGFDDTGDDLASPPAAGGPSGADAPPLSEVDDVATADEPAVADAAEQTLAVDTVTAPTGPDVTTPWWVWTAVPALLAGAWLTATSLTGPAAATATSGGAFSRLLARHAAGLTSGVTR